MPTGRALLARLLLIQVVAWGATGLLVVAFAPRLLLLDPSVVSGSASLAPLAWLTAIVVVAIATASVGRRIGPILYQLEAGIAQLAPAEVLKLYAVPARLVGLGLGGTLVVAASTLVPSIRPPTNDPWTQLELVLLAVTIASMAALPAYVAMRATIAKAMERVAVSAAREAVEVLEGRGAGIHRVRRRLLAAVVAPVAFVALAASLLVHAHLRAFEASSRESEAVDLAHGAFDVAGADAKGLRQAQDEARTRGFQLDVDPTPTPFSASRDEEGHVVVRVPLADGHAVVRFQVAAVSRATGVCLALALGAAFMAIVLGIRLGGAFADDVALATRELETTGVAEILRGDPIRAAARFRSVAALMRAADELGGVFREFAAAQQRGIDARTSAERMRGQFLASMSHDLKGPLNATLGFAGLVARGALTDAQRESVGIIEQRGRELLYLIDTILDTARVEAGELTIAPEWSDVAVLVTGAVLDARDLAVGSKVDITGEIQPGLPSIFVDPARLGQALTAIILVATRMAERGHVIVRAALPAVGERLRFDVEVSGRGIAVADRDKVFDAFKHADRARRHGRLGLGPSLARSLVGLHGGGLDIETMSAGGTVFHMWVPNERPSRAPPPM